MAAIPRQSEMLKGVLEGCILELISRGIAYGYALTAELKSLGFDSIVEGTVYTILLRLEKTALVNVHREPSEKGPPRKLYSLSGTGEQARQEFWDSWRQLSSVLHTLKEEEV